jgi:hypothetical protein
VNGGRTGRAGTPQQQVRIEVAEQEDGLEEGERRRPDAGRATELRQRQAADERFDREQQERRQCDRRAEQRAGARRPNAQTGSPISRLPS